MVNKVVLSYITRTLSLTLTLVQTLSVKAITFNVQKAETKALYGRGMKTRRQTETHELSYC